MSATTDFELEGRRFSVGRLDVDGACLSLEVLGKALGPAAVATLGGEAPDFGAILQALLSHASQISALLKIFAPHTKVSRGMQGEPGGPLMVPLKDFQTEVFGGRVDLIIAFLVHAVRAEHGCFLGGPNALGQLLEQLVGKPSASPTGPTG